MSSLDNLYLKMAPGLEPAALASLHHESPPLNHCRHVGREVAHELNNIFTIIRGYADRMIIKHGENPALRPELLLITENVKRAESVVRDSAFPRSRSAPSLPVHPVP